MEIASFDSSAAGLRPLEFSSAWQGSVACTPCAADLAGIGLAAAGFGFFAARAVYHRGHFDDRDDIAVRGDGSMETMSADELLAARRYAATGS